MNNHLEAIQKICTDFDDGGIASVGARAALQAMSRHWAEHLAEGWKPGIVPADIDDAIEKLSEMRIAFLLHIGEAEAGRAEGNAEPSAEKA